jgi:hypothetical protein
MSLPFSYSLPLLFAFESTVVRSEDISDLDLEQVVAVVVARSVEVPQQTYG